MSQLDLGTAATAPPPHTARLMLLDTYGLVYRAFFALPALTTTAGVSINAAYGFTQMMTRIIADEQPTHVIACFDKGLPHARVAMYQDYKAQRETMPDDLRSQFALVRRILEVYRIPTIEVEGEEADDVIATLARQAVQSMQDVLVVTGDLDLLQLVEEHVLVLVTRRGITELGRYDLAAVRERFDLDPAQLADYRGLKGDPSDNLPGIPGIGEKTAIKLIKAAGSLDALLADPALAGSPKLERLVREHGEVARLCRDVSLISRDLPVSIPWDEARYVAPSSDELYVLYRDLEFKSLLARLPAPSNDALLAYVEQRESVGGQYRSFVASTDPPEFVLLASVLNEIPDGAQVAFARGPGAELGLSAQAHTAVSFDLAALGHAPVHAAFAALLRRTVPLAHDAKSLARELRAYGLELPPVRDDTMVAAYLLNPSRSYASLSDAVTEYLALHVPEDTGAHADAVVRLAPVLRDHLQHRGQTALYDDIELPLVAILTAMERAGLGVDVAELDELAREVEAAAARLQGEIYALAGETFNIGSPQQLGAILFEKLGLPSGGRNKTGWSTGVDVLQKLARAYPICAKVLEYREVTKLKSTYIDVIPRVLGADGRLHTQFNQTSTATGRLSSTNPNLQNIPVRTELGRRVRRAFVAPPQRMLIAADYSQIELRIMAHLSGDEAMRAAFLRGDDIHDVTARGIFAVPPDAAVTPNQRRIAKSVNFGLLYGMSDFGLAQRLEIDRAEARAMTEAYFARFPGVLEWTRRNLEFGREHGYVETIVGRRRYLPDLRARNRILRSAAEREATNAPMQGSASDLMKLAMVHVDVALRDAPGEAVMLLQIHDELIVEVAQAHVNAVAHVVRKAMEEAMPLSVPIEVTLKTGHTLYDIQPLDDAPDEDGEESEAVDV